MSASVKGTLWIRLIKKYKKSLTTLGINTEKVILYGSYAYGQAVEGSDIDLIVVSSDFVDKNIDRKSVV